MVNAAESAVVHVDGGTSQVDARVELPAGLDVVAVDDADSRRGTTRSSPGSPPHVGRG